MNDSNNINGNKICIKQIKYECKIKNIKSDYFLRTIFGSIQKVKSIGIIKYNKKMQIRLNIDIKDFKEYSQKYSPIEIEIIPLRNKYGNFINIIKKEEESFFHIFLTKVIMK